MHQSYDDDDDGEPIIPPGTDNLMKFVTSLWIERMHRYAEGELERKYGKDMMHQGYEDEDEARRRVDRLADEMQQEIHQIRLARQAEQQEEFAMFRPYDPNPHSPGIDLPYSPTIDPTLFTKILVAAGYRPYLLKREDTGETQTVWSKSSDLSRYASGEATPIKMVNGMEISSYAPVILMDEQDGGTINEHFHQVKRK